MTEPELTTSDAIKHDAKAAELGTWDDYQQSLFSAGSYGWHDDDTRVAFRHGVRIVFSLLANEFPPAAQCKAAGELLTACKDLVGAVVISAPCIPLPDAIEQARKLIAKAEPTA